MSGAQQIATSSAPPRNAPSSIMLGAWIAALLPLVWLMPALQAHTPFTLAPWEGLGASFRVGLEPVRRALEALCAMVPIGSQALRASLLIAATLSALCAAAYVWLELLLRRIEALPTAPRGPLALGVVWAIVSVPLSAEPVLARVAPYAPGLALAFICLAQRAALTRAPHTLRATVQLALFWLLTLLEQPLFALLIAPILAPVVRELRGVEALSELTKRAAIASDAPKPATHLAQAAGLTFMLLGVILLRDATHSVAAIRSEGFEELREALLQDAPPRSLLVLQGAIAGPLAQAREAARARPDVRIVSSTALLAPQNAERIATAHPELKALVRASLLRGALDAVELQALSATRPVRLAPDAQSFVATRETLLPGALSFESATSTAMSADLKAAWTSTERARTLLFAELDPILLDSSTRAFLSEQCALTAALLAGLQRGAVLAEQLDLATLYAVDTKERETLRAVLVTVGIPAAALTTSPRPPTGP